MSVFELSFTHMRLAKCGPQVAYGKLVLRVGEQKFTGH
jgi:hypothetical protein